MLHSPSLNRPTDAWEKIRPVIKSDPFAEPRKQKSPLAKAHSRLNKFGHTDRKSSHLPQRYAQMLCYPLCQLWCRAARKAIKKNCKAILPIKSRIHQNTENGVGKSCCCWAQRRVALRRERPCMPYFTMEDCSLP
jgi:hypothetical protein